MAKYKGYLLKVKDQIFPMKYIKSETYTSTDNQRSELKAYRDTNNYLIRQTSPNFKTKIEFETPPLLQSQYEEIRQLLNQGTINRTERKINNLLELRGFNLQKRCGVYAGYFIYNKKSDEE